MSQIFGGKQEEITTRGNEATKGRTTISQQGMYAKIAEHFPEIYDALAKGLTDHNPAVRVGAAKVLLNKILPDLKSVEVGGVVNEDGSREGIKLLINTGSGFIPATVQPFATSTTSSFTGTTTVQNPDMASESKKDDNSDIRDSQAGTS